MNPIRLTTISRNNQSITAGHLTALSGVFNFFRSQANHLADSDFSFFVAFRSAHPLYDKVAFTCFAKFSIDRTLGLLGACQMVNRYRNTQPKQGPGQRQT